MGGAGVAQLDNVGTHDSGVLSSQGWKAATWDLVLNRGAQLAEAADASEPALAAVEKARADANDSVRRAIEYTAACLKGEAGDA